MHFLASFPVIEKNFVVQRLQDVSSGKGEKILAPSYTQSSTVADEISAALTADVMVKKHFQSVLYTFRFSFSGNCATFKEMYSLFSGS